MSRFLDESSRYGIRILFLLGCLAITLLIGPGRTVARAEFFTIRSFHADIVVHRDSSLTVTETIETFFDFRRHGIYRDIPFRYTDELGRKTIAPIQIVSVTDQFRTERPYRVNRTGDAVRVRIGKRDRYVEGMQIYIITYMVKNAILFLNDRDELYWNVTGNDWGTTIRNASARVTVESERGEIHSRGSCYTGFRGSRESSCDFAPFPQGGEFRTKQSLPERTGLTIALGWDRGIVSKASPLEVFLWSLDLAENWVFLIPFGTFAFMLVHWYRRGKDPDVGDVVAVLYTPPEEDGHPLLPAEIGALFDERLDPADITASIVDLAVRGYITIEERKEEGFLFDRTDYLLKRVKEADVGLAYFEKRLLADLFEGKSDRVLVSDLKYSFYKNLDGLKNAVFSRLRTVGYFRSLPQDVKTLYFVTGIVVCAIGILFGGVTGIFATGSPWKVFVAFAVSGLAISLFAPFMPVKTRRGALALAKVKGFEEFLVRAEKDRLERMKDQNLFERYLPYAIALGVSDRWASAFEGIYQEVPRWYVSGGGFDSFHPASFQRSLGTALSDMGNAMYAAPRSSGGGGSGGGGSSGGGFGGGGGGSW